MTIPQAVHGATCHYMMQHCWKQCCVADLLQMPVLASGHGERCFKHLCLEQWCATTVDVLLLAHKQEYFETEP